MVGLCLVLGLALPAQGQDEAPGLQVTPVADPNDEVVILSNGIPTTELRIRVPEVRIYENRHAIGEPSEPGSIPTRGPSSRPVDVVYHGTLDYGEPSGIVTRSFDDTSVVQPIVTHGFASPPSTSGIRYHGGFR